MTFPLVPAGHAYDTCSTCDHGSCSDPTAGWRYYPSPMKRWLPVCIRHLANAPGGWQKRDARR